MGLIDSMRRFFGPAQGPPPELKRNDPCWCGSGRKYKACHLETDEQSRAAERAAACWTGGG